VHCRCTDVVANSESHAVRNTIAFGDAIPQWHAIGVGDAVRESLAITDPVAHADWDANTDSFAKSDDVAESNSESADHPVCDVIAVALTIAVPERVFKSELLAEPVVELERISECDAELLGVGYDIWFTVADAVPFKDRWAHSKPDSNADKEPDSEHHTQPVRNAESDADRDAQCDAHMFADRQPGPYGFWHVFFCGHSEYNPNANCLRNASRLWKPELDGQPEPGSQWDTLVES
jgi:hypothetical protein